MSFPHIPFFPKPPKPPAPDAALGQQISHDQAQSLRPPAKRKFSLGWWAAGLDQHLPSPSATSHGPYHCGITEGTHSPSTRSGDFSALRPWGPTPPTHSLPYSHWHTLSHACPFVHLYVCLHTHTYAHTQPGKFPLARSCSQRGAGTCWRTPPPPGESYSLLNQFFFNSC